MAIPPAPKAPAAVPEAMPIIAFPGSSAGETPPAPGVAINDPKQDPNANLITAATPALAPSVAINDEKTGNEIEADPGNPIPNPSNVKSSDKELGPTWLDALLLAIRSCTLLLANLGEKGIEKFNEAYIKHWQARQQSLKEKIKTELEAHPGQISGALQKECVKAATEIVNTTKAAIQDGNLPVDEAAPQIEALEEALKNLQKLPSIREETPEELAALEAEEASEKAVPTPTPGTAQPAPPTVPASRPTLTSGSLSTALTEVQATSDQYAQSGGDMPAHVGTQPGPQITPKLVATQKENSSLQEAAAPAESAIPPTQTRSRVIQGSESIAQSGQAQSTTAVPEAPRIHTPRP